MESEKYIALVKEKLPKAPMVKTLVPAFLVGGLICCIGQFISDMLRLIVPDIDSLSLGTATSIILIFIGSLLTGLGLYEKIGHYAGGGSIIPITGFANSIVSPAMEFNREGIVFGVCANMFIIAGPVIVFGIVASILVGLVGMIWI